MTTLDYARRYIALGWHVFPVWTARGGTCQCRAGATCKTPGKHPKTENGQDNATTDAARADRWFKRGDVNIGVACGPSQLVVIDADVPRPKNGNTDGRKALAELIEEHGPLPATPTADTGSGGTHMVFAAPAGVQLIGKIGKAIDIKRNGLIVAPPSVHVTGGVYRWRTGLSPSEIAIAELTPEWIDLLRVPEPEERPASKGEAVGEDFYAALESLDQRHVLQCVSGSWLTNGERFAFKASRKGNGKHNLLVDRGDGWEGTSNFIDSSGRIAAHSTGNDDGGPLASTWLRWYKHDDKAIYRGLIELVPELAAFVEAREAREARRRLRDEQPTLGDDHPNAPHANGVPAPADPPRDVDDEESAAIHAEQMGAAEHRSTPSHPTPDEERAQNGAARAEHGGEIEIDIKRGPQPAADNGADPFAEELRRALADVKAALGRDQLRQRRPLFEADAALLLTEEFPSTQWQVTGLITRGATAMIGGLPKAAKKTWLATEIAVAIATGTPVCGEFFAERGTVRYFYAEDTRRQVRNRIRALLAGAGRNMPVGRLLLQPRGEFLDLLRDEDLAWIVASCRRGDKPDLLVLDPLRDIHSGEEDKSDSMREVMRRLRLLGELLGCTVLTVHHHGKPSETTAKRGGGQRMRGSGSIHGSADAGIHFMECDGDGVSVFTNTVESEIKGARSAGRFTLELRIEDDERGEAVRAQWSAKHIESKPSKKEAIAAAKTAQAAQDAADDKLVFEFVRTLAMRGEQASKSALRTHDEAPLGERRMRPALERLIELGRLQIINRKIGIPEPGQHDA